MYLRIFRFYINVASSKIRGIEGNKYLFEKQRWIAPPLPM